MAGGSFVSQNLVRTCSIESMTVGILTWAAALNCCVVVGVNGPRMAQPKSLFQAIGVPSGPTLMSGLRSLLRIFSPSSRSILPGR